MRAPDEGLRPPRAIVLAAGLGTRLGALSDERPKPLLPVCDVPLIRYALALLAGHGITEVAVNLHHRGELIADELGTGADLGLTITYSREETILGTGGGLVRLADFLTQGGQEPFLVVNGKILVDLDLDAVLALHRRKGAAATMVVREVPDAHRWGAIEVGEDGRVDKIIGAARPGARERLRACMFTGIHVISPGLLARLPPEGESDSIRQGYLPALADGDLIAGHVLEGYFHEHSTPARYLEGNWNALSGRARLRHPPGTLTGVDPSATVAKDARLVAPYRVGPGAIVEAGAVVGPFAVVGRRARVAAGARIERVVAWPDAAVEGSVADAIVTPRGVFAVEDAPAPPR